MRDDVGTRRMVAAQRGALAGLLASLADAEWDVASLCAGWRVRDVVAHCVQNQLATPLRVLGGWVGAGLSMDRRNRRWVHRYGDRDPAELLRRYRETAGLMRFPAGEAPHALVEDVLHGYDIARPLGRRLAVPEDALVLVADTCRRAGFMLHGRRRAAGLTLRATDADWTAGGGPVVTGPLEAIVLAVAGRRPALSELSGDGLDLLRSRP